MWCDGGSLLGDIAGLQLLPEKGRDPSTEGDLVAVQTILFGWTGFQKKRILLDPFKRTASKLGTLTLENSPHFDPSFVPLGQGRYTRRYNLGA